MVGLFMHGFLVEDLYFSVFADPMSGQFSRAKLLTTSKTVNMIAV